MTKRSIPAGGYFLIFDVAAVFFYIADISTRSPID